MRITPTLFGGRGGLLIDTRHGSRATLATILALHYDTKGSSYNLLGGPAAGLP